MKPSRTRRHYGTVRIAPRRDPLGWIVRHAERDPFLAGLVFGAALTSLVALFVIALLFAS